MQNTLNGCTFSVSLYQDFLKFESFKWKKLFYWFLCLCFGLNQPQAQVVVCTTGYFWKIFFLPLPTKRNWHLQAKLISYFLLNPDFWLKKRNHCTNKFGHGNQLSRHVLGPSKRKEREDCTMVLGSSREVVSFDEGAKPIDWSSCINRNYFYTSNCTILSNAVAAIIELGAIHA